MKIQALSIIAATVALFSQDTLAEGQRYRDRQGARTGTPPTCAEATARLQQRSDDATELLATLEKVSCFSERRADMVERMNERSSRAEERLAQLCANEDDAGDRKLRGGFGRGGRGFGGGRGDGPPRGEGNRGPPRPEEWDCDEYLCATEMLATLESDFDTDIESMSNRAAKKMIGGLTFGIEEFEDVNDLSC